MIGNTIIALAGIILTDAVCGFIIWLAFFKQNKTIKSANAQTAQEDAEKAGISTEEKKIDLGDRYIESTKKMVDMLMESMGGSLSQIRNELERLGNEVKETRIEQERERKYLNGEYQKWLENNN